MIRSGLVRFHTELEPLLVDIDSIQQHPSNYNNGDVDKIAESIEVNGMYRPIYVQKTTGHIIAGNHTWTACKQLGATQIPVIYLNIDDATVRRILVGDNWIASLAVPDTGLLLELLETIEADTGLIGTGLLATDLDRLRNLAHTPLDDDTFNDPWPTICVQVPPIVRNAYMDLTTGAGGDRQRFEMLLRKAGWDG